MDRDWDNKVGAHRNVLTERSLPALLDEHFEKWVDTNFKNKVETVLFPAFLSYLNQVMKLAQEKKVSDDFIPTQGKANWCHRCDTSHEAEFFFLALLYHAAYNFVYSPGEWKFADQDLENRITKLYTDNKLADPKELGTFLQSKPGRAPQSQTSPSFAPGKNREMKILENPRRAQRS